jgi:hypothetical protein
MPRWPAYFLAAFAWFAAGGTATATPFDPQTLITDFNVITQGNFATTSDVRGNVLIGGNLSGNGILSTLFGTAPPLGPPPPPTGYGQINVFGDNSGTWAEFGQKAFLGGVNTGSGQFLNAIVTTNYTFPGAGGSPGEGSNAATFAKDI